IAIYQFRTAMPKLFNRNGENISHLQGLFYRTLHLLENGIKPVFVFDGQPPELKQPLVGIRDVRRGEAPVLRRSRLLWLQFLALQGWPGWLCLPEGPRLSVTELQGIAPAEAEATCAALVKSGKVWCTATEDMDALPFGSLRLIRHLSSKNNCEVEEFSLPDILQKLGMTQEQFVDLCILLGCDYCGKIWRLGPKKALKLLQQHGTIEQVLQNIDPQKHPLPANWDLEGARRLFLQPEVADPGRITLEWRDPDPEGLVRFLAHEKHMKSVPPCLDGGQMGWPRTGWTLFPVRRGCAGGCSGGRRPKPSPRRPSPSSKRPGRAGGSRSWASSSQPANAHVHWR
uniref:XPG-I domain-containing protein n=1 Tax=Chelonoidis abingdonii TaxID=106734 RepID=A0A8C0H723_CHEAB